MTKLSEISAGSFDLPPEQEAIRAKCYHPSGMFVEFEKEEIEQSIPHRFEKIALRHPDRLAVKTKAKEYTYHELNRTANQIAQRIFRHYEIGKKPIALLFEHDATEIVAILATLKAGRICVGLEPSYPSAKLSSILDDLDAELIVTNSHNLSLANELSRDSVPILNIDQVADGSDEPFPQSALSPSAPAAIFYTSGSTGKPKGVVHSHRSLLHNVMSYTNDVHICPSDRLTHFHSFSTFAAVPNLFGALLNGAGLYIFDPKIAEPGLFRSWLASQEITIFHGVPTVFRSLVENFTGRVDFPHLRLIQLASDSVTPRDVQQYQKYFSAKCLFVNRLGATETGTIARFFIDLTTPLPNDIVPVGFPVDGKEVFLLDDEGQRVGLNRVGKIVVASSFLATGYWRKSNLACDTRKPRQIDDHERFYSTGDLGRISQDGYLEHLGREDSQVKVRGHRIEIAEIEATMASHPTIKEAVVVGLKNEAGDHRLVAYIVSAQEPAPSVTDLKTYLRKKLPDYMVPSVFVFQSRLPLTDNGKVDRLALPPPGKSRPKLDTAFVEPSNPIERELVRLWAEVLDLDSVGTHDDFFLLGGDSLSASRIVSKVIQSFQIKLPMKALFDSPTIAQMALVVANNQQQSTDREELEQLLNEIEAMSGDEVERMLALTTENTESVDEK
jgi:amino acid adenylation domain-containing protein